MPAALYIFPDIQHGIAAADEVKYTTPLSQEAADLYLSAAFTLKPSQSAA